MPKYVTVEIDGAEPLHAPLRQLIEAFYKPFDEGGLVDDDRGEPCWTWDCMVTAKTSA